ncbi:cation:proton antiporter [uncultured Rhodoblastus sp.]|uniref:cation:proton antiporter n=1 Tax=uncultured Rhodoblastus sp. TaxID=543037 RepID=UPI0025EE590E|nr:cation:proton antiporter [uncultured Rhodoblastus sp.]
MDDILAHTIGYLCVGIVVAILARRVHLPYTVGLVFTGVVMALTGVETGAMLTHDFIFEIILPPLLFEAALSIHWSELRRDMAPVLVLATLGVLVSAGVVALGMIKLLAWPIGPAMVFGALIAATDPIAVLAMFKDTGIGGRLKLLVESESLFNDAAAAVLFALALTFVAATAGDPLSPLKMAKIVASMIGGGVTVGLACGGLAILIAGRIDDHLVETALTTVAAYGSFLLAESFHASGVLATVAAGLLMGNLGVLRPEAQDNKISSEGRAFTIAFWEFAAFIANSLIFLLIGLRVAAIPFQGFPVAAIAIAIALVVVGRALAVYPLCLMLRPSPRAIPLAEQHVLWWGGLRGALALALALSLPLSFPYHDEIIVAAFAVVVFSVVAQGLTMPLLLHKLGFLPAR